MKPSDLIQQHSEQLLAISRQFTLSNPRILEKNDAIFQDDYTFHFAEYDVIILVDANERTSLFDVYGLEQELSHLLNLKVKVITQRNLTQLLQEQIERHAQPLQALRVN